MKEAEKKLALRVLKAAGFDLIQDKNWYADLTYMFTQKKEMTHFTMIVSH